ncbi:maleylacetoacetate isomerase [Variovorax sp. YR216]|uniref:maleylacetoacetate isomerase n=1 Tax=Variovorax sp. YR216 TaxID=1882828 RepID=UPI00089CCF77|nr:maleylacetoacetate isomerase [Variovorax sp. YR216]SEA85996.1 maleylacetoacetate isomerase [Variovorax sp. YR216]
MKLYGYFRSGTSHRLRIALNLKGLSYEQVAIDLRNEKHLFESYRAINPQQLVPALDVGDGDILTQSPAIIEWLEELYPQPSLLPTNARDRAHVRALAAIIGCDVHPVNNRRILEKLRHEFGANEDAINEWCGTWISSGFDAYEALVVARTPVGAFSFGDRPSLADAHLIPQIESARRFKVDLERWPRLLSIDKTCSRLEEFRRAAPSAQPDAV